MSFSYLSTDPGSSDMSWVRMRVGDTSSGSYIVENEEISAFIDTGGNKVIGAVFTAERMGTYYARQADKTVGKLRISFAKAADGFFALASRIRMESSRDALPYAGGVSKSDRDSEADDSDRPARAFELDQFKNESIP